MEGREDRGNILKQTGFGVATMRFDQTLLRGSGTVQNHTDKLVEDSDMSRVMAGKFSADP